MKYGLKEETIEKINAVLSGFPEVEKAILYGSRAKGNFKRGSDIDLTLTGPGLAFKTMLRIDNELDDLLLPYHIDLSILEKISNPDLVEHITRVGVVFYERAGRPATEGAA
ncbi:MAG: nucleotidyltransferase domain-containing protein [Nitrospirota bacterium]